MASADIDVAVIGGGSAGISACLELARASDLKVALFETGAELGGMPRSCRLFFGMRDRWRLFTGPQYALKLNNLVRKTSTAARSILHRAQSRETFFEEGIRIRVEAPIRYVVPQKVKPVGSKPHLFPRLYPGPSFQLECTLTHPTVEAWSGAEIIWRKSFKKLIANNRVLLPVYRFDWGRVNVDKGILLKIKHSKNKTLR